MTVVLDDPGRTTNMINRRHHDGLNACLDDLETHRDELRGVVVTSAKQSFFSGPEVVLAEITPDEAATTYGLVVPIRDQLRRLETLGRPVAAAVTGSALGGGLELALACHYRAGLDAPGVVWGLAESTMGLLPGGGGLVRVTRMLGVTAAVEQIVGPGTIYQPAAGLQAGIVDELAPTREAVIAAALAWVLAQTRDGGPFRQRWERPGYRIPGSASLAADLPSLTDRVRRQMEGTPQLAPAAILEVAVESARSDIDTAFAAETRAFLELLHQPVTAAMSRLFFDLKAVADGASRPAGVPADRAVTTRLAAAQPPGGHAAQLSAEPANNADAMQLPAKHPINADGTPLPAEHPINADAMQLPAKHPINADGTPLPAEDAINADGTQLPAGHAINAGAAPAPGEVEVHRFAAAGVTPLVEAFFLVASAPVAEIRAAGDASDAAVAAAFDAAAGSGAIPVLVRGGRGSFIGRIVAATTAEAGVMLAQGIEGATIERAAGRAGYPIRLPDGPTPSGSFPAASSLASAGSDDDRPGGGTDAASSEDDQPSGGPDAAGAKDDRPSGGSDPSGSGDDRPSGGPDASGSGDDRPSGGPDPSGSGDDRISGMAAGAAAPDPDVVAERLMVAAVLEAHRAIAGGMRIAAADAGVASMLGAGFPLWTGGVLQYPAGYPGGLAGFVSRCDELVAGHGAGFAVPPELRDRARSAG